MLSILPLGIFQPSALNLTFVKFNRGPLWALMNFFLVLFSFLKK